LRDMLGILLRRHVLFTILHSSIPLGYMLLEWLASLYS
jgi:hypothetical protein